MEPGGEERELKRQRKRRSGWDAPVPAEQPAPSQAAANVSSLVQQQLALAMAKAAAGQAAPASFPFGGAGVSGTPSVLDSVAEDRRRRRIYVGSLHYALQESDVRAVFAPFGAIRSITLTVDPSTGHHKGFCFIEYEAAESAESALKRMDKFELAGRQISVGRPHEGATSAAPAGVATPSVAAMLAAATNPAAAAAQAVAAAVAGAPQRFNPTGMTKLYIGNVALHVGAEHLRAIFQPFGLVVGCEMVTDPATPGQHRGYGFLQYLEEKMARMAMDKMNNFELAGRGLRVAWAQEQNKPLPILPGVVLPAAPITQISVEEAIAAALRGANVPAPSSVAVSSAPSPPPPLAAPAAAAAPTTNAAAATAQEPPACIVLDNMVTEADLSDPALEGEIREECEKFGSVVRVEAVPNKAVPGAARIFVLFTTAAACAAAKDKLDGRFFGGNVVQAHLYDAEAFARGELGL